MNRKKLILLLVGLAMLLAAAGAVLLINYQKRVHQPEVLEPEVFEKIKVDPDLLIGLWRSGSMYYRYNEDGTGRTWDAAEDIKEEEASHFTWTVDKTVFTHLHQMEISSAIIPKQYQITKLNLQTLAYEDEFGMTFVFKKVE